MSKTISIDCDPKEVRLAIGSSGLTGVSIEHLLRAPLDLQPTEDYLDSPKTIAAIQMLLKKAGIKSGNAVMCIGRSSIELRSLQLPSVDKNELPDMVRFAAQRHFANVGDNWPIDFIVLKTGESTSEILAASMNPNRIDRISHLMDTCGLKLNHLVLRPMPACSVAIAKKPELATAPTLFVDFVNDEIDMAITEGKNVVFMRTIRTNSEQDEASKIRVLAGEIKRTLLAAVSQQSQLNVERVMLWGSPESVASMCNVLAGALNMPVDGLDPFDLVDVSAKAKQEVGEDKSRYAAVVGGMLVPSLTNHLIDFHNPRKREEKKAPIRQIALAATAATVLIGGGIYAFMSKHSALDSEIQDLSAKIDANKGALEIARKNTEQWKKLEKFLSGTYSVLEQLEYVSEKSLPPEKMIFRGTSFNLVGSRNDFEGVVTTNYIIPDQIYKTEAENRLRSPDRVVIGGGVIPNPDKNSPYKWASNLSMRLAPRKVEDIRKWKDVASITPEKSDPSEAEPAPVDTKASDVKANVDSVDALEADDSNVETSTTGTTGNTDNTGNQETAS
jgi:Tfp pilus assembly PilM family ATPase